MSLNVYLKRASIQIHFLAVSNSLINSLFRMVFSLHVTMKSSNIAYCETDFDQMQRAR